MPIFTGQNISCYFKKLYDAIERKIRSYDYRQLNDFGPNELEAFVSHYSLGSISVDIENARREVKNDEGDVYNYDSQVFDDEPEYKTVKGKTITFYAQKNMVESQWLW